MKPQQEDGSTISSEEVNFLVYNYLQESGERDLWFKICSVLMRRYDPVGPSDPQEACYTAVSTLEYHNYIVGVYKYCTSMLSSGVP